MTTGMINDLTWPQMTSIDLIHSSSVFYDTHHIFLMLPFVPGGDLFTLIHSKNDFKKEDIKGYAYQIVKIFIFLHRKGSFLLFDGLIWTWRPASDPDHGPGLKQTQKSVPLIYRDLKPENILINYNGWFARIHGL